jgi:phospholipase C
VRLAPRFFLLLVAALVAITATAQISSFQHIVVIVQENRTPDNLFQELCGPNRSLCPNPYNLQNVGVNSKGQSITLTPVQLGTEYDLGHSHNAFFMMCDYDSVSQKCKMDKADKTGCTPSPTFTCPTNPQFQFVQASDIGPYLALAQQYGFANFMFQTNQGPSAPAHQFLFAGTSAASVADDQAAIFVANNPKSSGKGCLSPLGTVYQSVSPQTAPNVFKLVNDPLGTVCFSHPTMASLLDSNLPQGPPLKWKYYSPGENSIWTAPNWISDICQPNAPNYTKCLGSEWKTNVDLNPTHVLTDIDGCKLARVSWVIPTGQNSDHPNKNHTGGPSWVASVVNRIGQNTTCDGTGYWNDTAIVLTWDDWGGWFDHESPTFLSQPNQGEGDYQYGFRVPLVVVSAYTPAGYVNNERNDFGSILRFIEHNFGIQEGALNFADQRSNTDLTGFFNLGLVPRVFVPVAAAKDANYFLNDKSPIEPPDTE